METTNLRRRILAFVQHADVEHLKRLEAFIIREPSDLSILTEKQKVELDEQEAFYASGNGEVYAWNDIKQELIDEHGLST